MDSPRPSRAVTLNPLDPNAHSGKGVVLFYLRRYDEARSSLPGDCNLVIWK